MATEIKNACILLFTGRNFDRVLMVRNRATRYARNEGWMIPGGQIDCLTESRSGTPQPERQRRGKPACHCWEKPFVAAAREFREETGFNLPGSRADYKEVEITHGDGTKTAIYIGRTRNRFPNYDISKVKQPPETDKLTYVCFQSLWDNNFEFFRTGTRTLQGKQYLIRYNTNSFLFMKSRAPNHIKRLLIDAYTRATTGNGCGVRNKGAGGGVKGVKLKRQPQPASKCVGGRRKKTRRRRKKRRKTKRRKNKKRKKTRRRKHR